MLNENDVVRHLCAHLQVQGYVVESACTTAESGVDIIALRAGERLLIEAKGATSSKSTSARYGRPFDSNQVRDHVANAVYVALRLNEAKAPCEVVALAFPKNDAHKMRVGKVEATLSRLGIGLYWVSDDGTVDGTRL